jgi:hypothetical protein
MAQPNVLKALVYSILGLGCKHNYAPSSYPAATPLCLLNVNSKFKKKKIIFSNPLNSFLKISYFILDAFVNITTQ